MKNKFLLALTVFFVLCFTSCNNIAGNLQNKNADKAFLKFVLEEGSNVSRSAYNLFDEGDHIDKSKIYPENLSYDDIAKIEFYDGNILIATWTDETTPGKNALDSFTSDDTINLPLGPHVFNLKLYNRITEEVEEQKVVGVATCIMTIRVGYNEVYFNTQAPEEGTGFIDYYVGWANPKVKAVKMGLFKFDDELKTPLENFPLTVQEIDYTYAEDSKYFVNYKVDGVPVGTVAIKWITYSDKEATKEISSGIVIANIENNRISYGDRFIEDEEANYKYKINYNFNVPEEDPDQTVWLDGYTPLTERSYYSAVALPTSERFFRNNYTFLNWYVCVDDDGNLVDDGEPNLPLYEYFGEEYYENIIPVGYEYDITVYAMWIPNYIDINYVALHESETTEVELGVSYIKYIDNEFEYDYFTGDEIFVGYMEQEMEFTPEEIEEEKAHPKTLWKFTTRVKSKYDELIYDEEEKYTNYDPDYITWYVDGIMKGTSPEFTFDPRSVCGGTHTISAVLRTTVYDPSMIDYNPVNPSSSCYYLETIGGSYEFTVEKNDWQLLEKKDMGSYWGGEFSNRFVIYKYKIPEDVKLTLFTYATSVISNEIFLSNMINNIDYFAKGYTSLINIENDDENYLNAYCMLGKQDELGFAFTGIFCPFYIDKENGFLYYLETNLTTTELFNKYDLGLATKENYMHGYGFYNSFDPYRCHSILKFNDGKMFSFETSILCYDSNFFYYSQQKDN